MAGITTRVFDAGPVWGFATTDHAHHDTCHRITVFPPGATVRERRWLWVWHHSTAITGLVLLVTIILAAAVGTSGAVAVVGAVILTPIPAVAAWIATRETRPRQAVMEVWIEDPRMGRRSETERRDALRMVAARLRRADDQLRSGQIDAVAHGQIWTECHSHIRELCTRQSVTP